VEQQRRYKWIKGTAKIPKGTLVLLKDDHLPPLQWNIGRIIEVHPGADDVTRVVTVKTAHGQFKRSARSVCPLPLDDDVTALANN